jgi:hypothetical protein
MLAAAVPKITMRGGEMTPESAWRFVTLMLAALNTGLTAAHVLEMPAKMRMGPREYATTQTIYRPWGLAGALLEPGSVLGASMLAFLLRHRQPSGRLTFLGAGALGAALAAWIALVAPMNTRMLRDWSSQPLPADWMETRRQWEWSHAGRFGLQAVGLGALLGSVIAETSQTPRASRWGALLGTTAKV